MEITGKLIKKLPLETGTSKSGNSWQKQTVVIDTGNEFNNLAAISAFGDKVAKLNKLEVGMQVAILCNVYSREYKGKYYHNIDGYHFVNKSETEEVSEMVTSDDMPF